MRQEIQAVLAGQSPGCVICGDCLEVLPGIPEKCVDLVLTDPPYGCAKAEWDAEFFGAWYRLACAVSVGPIGIITGSCGLRDSIPLVGSDFVDVISGRNMNGMTRGPIGFGNWLSCVVARSKPKLGPNAFSFSVVGDMPDHPSPKPIEFMLWLVKRLSEVDDVVIDPMCGSGTTLLAAKMLGRRYIGIEISEDYCRIARERLASVDSGVPVKEARAGQLALFS